MSKKVAVVYWSQTGNTEEMARAFEEALSEAGAEVQLRAVSEFSADEVGEFDALAFGCPSMGAEELEADEFEPVWTASLEALASKPVVLFGSYGWGSGEWMDTWKEGALEAGITVVETVIANETPDEDALESCAAAATALLNA